MGLFTNGNADLTDCPAFGPYFSLNLAAGDVGAAKPSPIPFIACVQNLRTVPGRVLYIGDSYKNDVLGAKNVGICSAMLLRPDVARLNNIARSLSVDADLESDKVMFHEADMMLHSLDPQEIMKAVNEFATRSKG